MKWLMTFNICLASAGLAMAQPMPMNAYPHPIPLPTAPTVASPTLTGNATWQAEGYPAPAAPCGKQGCAAPMATGKSGGSAFERFCEWISFRPCPPVHTMCVPQPPRAPLRAYFSNSDCGIGCANAADCGKAGCGKGRGYTGGTESVFIPAAKRGCAQAHGGGSAMWGRGAVSCGSGSLGSWREIFGLSEGSCGGKACGRGGCGAGGCTNCQYTKTPMSDIGQYHNFTVTQSVGRTSGLTNPGAAPAGSHYANPYRAVNAELQYTQPGATLAPAKPMPAPQTPPVQGTQGMVPYNRPLTNP
jgi:hypothetical protein